MNFKEWLILSETIDEKTKDVLKKWDAPEDELMAFIKELENTPDMINRKDAFIKINARFPLKQKVTKQEDPKIKFYREKLEQKEITKPEFDVFMLFKDENRQQINEMMNLLRKFTSNKIITLEVKDNKIYLKKSNEVKQFNELVKFLAELHSIEGSLTKYKQKSGMFNPVAGELSHAKNLVAKGDNIWVFRGDNSDLASTFGKNQRWCTSHAESGPANLFLYRAGYNQTHYFVFDFNKDVEDPARYVLAGVAPNGTYSEWVDAENTPGKDSEDDKSGFNINGYKSANEYKNYLAKKGIDKSIWVTIEPEDWEKRTKDYIVNKEFHLAKDDEHPEVLNIYLKHIPSLSDEYFEELNDAQKSAFLSGRFDELTDNQFEYAKNISGYYNSLHPIKKIDFAIKTDNQDLMLKLAKNPELTDDSVLKLLKATHYSYTMAINIIENKSELTDDDFSNLIESTDREYFLEHMIKRKKELNDNNISSIVKFWADFDDKDKVCKLVIQYKKELSDDNIVTLLLHADKVETIASILGSDNINKLSNNSVNNLLFQVDHETYGIKKIIHNVKMAELIIKYKENLTDRNIQDLKRCLGPDKANMLMIKYNHKEEDPIVKYRKPSGKYKHKLEWTDNFTP